MRLLEIIEVEWGHVGEVKSRLHLIQTRLVVVHVAEVHGVLRRIGLLKFVM